MILINTNNDIDVLFLSKEIKYSIKVKTHYLPSNVLRKLLEKLKVPTYMTRKQYTYDNNNMIVKNLGQLTNN